MTPRETAEAYVRTKLPELMELSLGCEVKIKSLIKRKKGGFIVEKWDFSTLSIGAEGSVYDIEFGEVSLKHCDYQIIGHPIQLAHVLRLLVEDWRSEFLEVWDLDENWDNQEERVFEWLCNEWKL